MKVTHKETKNSIIKAVAFIRKIEKCVNCSVLRRLYRILYTLSFSRELRADRVPNTRAKHKRLRVLMLGAIMTKAE